MFCEIAVNLDLWHKKIADWLSDVDESFSSLKTDFFRCKLMIVVSKQKNGFMLKVYTFEQISFFVAILVNIKQACVFFTSFLWNETILTF